MHLLVIVGGRDEAEIGPFRKLALEHGVEAVFAGYRPPAEIPAWLFAADVLAMPYAASLATATGEDTARWMSPLKMFEYMASGRPIVASDLPALREVLRPEENALLALPGRADSLGEQIGRALNDEALAGRLGACARADVEAYSWDSRAAKILEGWQ
jgi:glycosyltransferase involved in cell wall biosynthesis